VQGGVTTEGGEEPGGRVPGAATRWARAAERVFLLAGLVLFVALLRRMGPGIVFENIRLVGWGIGLIVVQEIFAYAANTLGWRFAFPLGPPIPFSQLLAVRIAGDAVSHVTPTATLGGDFVRVRLLRGCGPTSSVVASVTIAKLSQIVAQVAFIVLGLVVMARTAPVPRALYVALLSGMAVLACLALSFLLVQRRGLFTLLGRPLRAIGFAGFGPVLGDRLERFDAEIERFYAGGPSRFLASTAWFLVGWALGVLEACLILFFLGVPMTMRRLVVIEVLSVAIDAVVFFVPGKVGVQEGGKVLIFTLLGLDPAKGLSFGLVRRIRELAWAGIGLVIFSRLQAVPRPATDAAPIRG
jgi:putative membrane protein